MPARHRGRGCCLYCVLPWLKRMSGASDLAMGRDEVIPGRDEFIAKSSRVIASRCAPTHT
jgi:hypothetical protein